MEIWKRNLIVCWFGMFVTAIGMSQIAPVLPLYIEQLGIHNTALIEQWSGIAFGVTFIISAIFSPIWGKAADKYGRKPMLLRASLGMAFVTFCIGFAQNVYQLVTLRLLQGVITGYSTACITLIATQTDKEHAGWALGTLSTASIAGSLVELIVAGVLIIPQAFVNSPWELIGFRFLFGMAAAGLGPSLNALVKKITPDSLTGRVFGFSISTQYLGLFGGSLLGGQVAANFGIPSVFFITSILLLANALWVYKTVYREAT